MLWILIGIAVLFVAAAVYNPVYLIGSGVFLTIAVWLGCLRFYWFLLAAKGV